MSEPKPTWPENVLANKVVLITGGTGSFGQTFTTEALKHGPKAIRIYSRGELLQVEMERKFQNPRLRFFIGDVRDKERLHRAMSGADIVIHAAALKHVPVCEYSPIEAVKTNIMGAVNVIDCAIDCKVEKVIAISTDKAVYPVNLYGATKSVAEKLIIQANSYSGGKPPRFSVVRYGNVAGSRGSLLTLLSSMREGGEVTITDDRMTRFWIPLPQAVSFVLDRLEDMVGGEIFVPKIPAMRVLDLVDALAPDCKHNLIGIRPGEKLHEVLVTSEEARHTKDLGTHLVIEPEFPFWREETLIGGEALPDGFEYSSRTTEWRLTPEEMKELEHEHATA